MRMGKNKAISTKYVDVLDGIRAVSVIIVLIFHFWQQTWIFPTVKTPFLAFMGVPQIDFTPFAKVGYLFVDMMILISGFLLFLPVARNVLLGEKPESFKAFFRKRAIRILPSYLFCILVLFVYELAHGGYGTPADTGWAIRDLVSHLLFLHTWKIKTYLSTKLNVVLWTLAVEVWFYVLFPLFAAFIRRRKKEKTALRALIRAALLAVALIGVSHLYIHVYVDGTGSDFSNSVDAFLKSIGSDIRSSYLSIVINQLPAFFEVYAVGLAGALIYVAAASKLRRSTWVGLAFTAGSIGFIYLMVQMLKSCAALDPAGAQAWQIHERLKLACVFMGLILTTAFSAGFYRFLFSNRLMKFLAGISYNLYIWHQWLCVKLKNDWRIPFWEGDTPPNQLYTAEAKAWSWRYAFVITAAAFIAAVLATYLIERPAADLLNRRKSIYNGKLKELFAPKAKAPAKRIGKK